jgi:hypothetical protein
MTEPNNERSTTTTASTLIRPFGHPMTEPTDGRSTTTTQSALIRPFGHPMTDQRTALP